MLRRALRIGAIVVLLPTAVTLARNVPAAADPVPQTIVTMDTPVVFGDSYNVVGFGVSYAGGVDGSTVVVQWGDGTLSQYAASGFRVWASHSYPAVNAYPIHVEVYTSGCLAPCATAGVAVVPHLPQNCPPPPGGGC
jgi:hypothetical protein